MRFFFYGTAKNQVKAIVTNAKGDVVEGIEVNFSADNGASPENQSIKTNAKGEAIFEVTNTEPGQTTISATVNNTSIKKVVTFVEEGKIPILKDVIVLLEGQLANGKDKNKVKAIITDEAGEPMRDIAVEFSANNGASPSSLVIETNDKGEAIFEVANTRAESTTVTATVNGKNIRKEIHFGFTDFYITPKPKLLTRGDSQILTAIAEDGEGNKYSMVFPGAQAGDELCNNDPFWCAGAVEPGLVSLEVLPDGRAKVTGLKFTELWNIFADRKYKGQKLSALASSEKD